MPFALLLSKDPESTFILDPHDEEESFMRSYWCRAFSLPTILCIFWLFVPALFMHCPLSDAADLMEVFKLAQEHDPVFQREAYKHEASSEILKQAYADLLPTVTAEGIYKRTRQEIEETEVAVYAEGLVRYPSKGYTVTLSQPLFKLPLIYRVGQAREQVAKAGLIFEVSRQDLMLRVSEVYMGVLEAQDNLAFSRAEEAAVAIHFELAQGRYKNGLAPVTDLHDAKARLADVTALKVKAENRLDDALSALEELTGTRIENISGLQYASFKNSARAPSVAPAGPRSETSPPAVQGADQGGAGTEQKPLALVSPDPDDLEKWIDSSSEQNLEVAIQRREVEVMEREVARQRAGHFPVVSLVGRMNRYDEGGSLFGGESDISTRDAYVQLTVPLFQGLSVLSRTREAMKLHQAARADLEREIRAAERRTRAAFLGVKSAIENAEAYRQAVMFNDLALIAKREGFKSGLFPSLAVLDAERDLHRARQEYARAHYGYLVSGLRLKKAVGILVEEDLSAMNQWLK